MKERSRVHQEPFRRGDGAPALKVTQDLEIRPPKRVPVRAQEGYGDAPSVLNWATPLH